tara:strand:- start:773 stop:1561 length:789 start_codon:yes stop_codon:yes gene_type:complete
MLLTIAIVTYNCENILIKTLLSVSDLIKNSNEYSSLIEVIAIDGDSTDSTLIKLNESKVLDTIVSEKDRGIYDAMNKAAKIAKGRYIIYMNAGDYFCCDEIIILLEHLNNNESDVVYGDTIVETSDHRKILSKANKNISLTNSMPFCHQSVFTRTRIVRDIGFNEKFNIVADKALFFSAYKKNCKFTYLPYKISLVDLVGLSGLNPLATYKEYLDMLLYNKAIHLISYYCRYIVFCSSISFRNVLPKSILKLIRQLRGYDTR